MYCAALTKDDALIVESNQYSVTPVEAAWSFGRFKSDTQFTILSYKEKRNLQIYVWLRGACMGGDDGEESKLIF